MTCLITNNIPWYYCTIVCIFYTIKNIFDFILVGKKIVRDFYEKKRTHISLASKFFTMAVKDRIFGNTVLHN